nr:hypothetical protein [Halalkalicoccus jeotgali]
MFAIDCVEISSNVDSEDGIGDRGQLGREEAGAAAKIGNSRIGPGSEESPKLFAGAIAEGARIGKLANPFLIVRWYGHS